MKKVKRLTKKGIFFLSLLFWPIALGLIINYDRNFKEVNGIEACMIVYLSAWGLTGIVSGIMAVFAYDDNKPALFTIKTIETEDKFITAYKQTIKELEEKNEYLSSTLVERELCQNSKLE